MIKNISAALAVLAAVACAVPSGGARAADAVADFYKDKTVSIYVGLGAGGIYSIMAQTMAKHLGRHIPGHPTVIVVHQPGAGGIIAANNVYNVQPKDGTVALTPNGGMTKRYVLGEPAAKFDPAKWHWLGGWGEPVNDCTVWKAAPATSLKEAMTKEVVIGTIDTGSNTHTNPLLMNNLLGTKFKLVPGYRGGADVRLAMERNEVHGFCGQFEGWKSAKPEWLRDGKLAHLVQLASKRSADMPNTPLLSEFARNDEEREIFSFIQSSIEDRAMVMAPGVPAERVAAMEKAYMAMLRDPAFVADANTQKFDIDPATGEEIRKSIAAMTALKKDYIVKIRKAQGLD